MRTIGGSNCCKDHDVFDAPKLLDLSIMQDWTDTIKEIVGPDTDTIATYI